ncbi:MAG: hypothetical protein V3S56_09405, partial [Gemmatimonadota bacterium]
EDERFCSVHAGQATDAQKESEEPQESDGSQESDESQESESCCESIFNTDPLDALLALAVGGALIVAAIAFRRVIRIL